jgi:hypothetical protein
MMTGVEVVAAKYEAFRQLTLAEVETDFTARQAFAAYETTREEATSDSEDDDTNAETDRQIAEQIALIDAQYDAADARAKTGAQMG